MPTINHNTQRDQQLVYVVDDFAEVAELLSSFLTTAGYRTEMFVDPCAAFAAFESATRKPSLLISDFQMPRMNGMELIERCKGLSPSLKTVSFSGTLYADKDLERYRVKPDLALRKPLKFEDLVRAVDGLFAMRTPGA